MGLLKKLHRGEAAQVLPMFVMLLIVLVGMIGLATDLGRIYVARAQLGRSVDAAALAGAKQLPDITQADVKARAYIAENEPYAIDRRAGLSRRPRAAGWRDGDKDH